MCPLETAADDNSSIDVRTVTLCAPADAAPMVMPLINSNNADALIVAPNLVMTKKVVVTGLNARVKLFRVKLLTPSLPVTSTGRLDRSKNKWGYVTVTVPPGGIGLAGTKPRVTVTDDLPAIRSYLEMSKVTLSTCPNICPEATGAEAFMSDEDCKLMSAPAVAEPIVKPCIVTVNAGALIAAP